MKRANEEAIVSVCDRACSTCKKDRNGNKYWEVFKREGCDHVVRAGILKHRIPCFGYVIRENNQPGPLDAKKVREKGLRPGPDYHKLKMGQDVTLPDGKTVIRASGL